MPTRSAHIHVPLPPHPKLHGKKAFGFVLGPLLFAACLALLAGFAFPVRAAVGLLLWMCVWWVLLPVPVAVTAFLPIIINAFFDLVPMGTVTGKYFSEITILLLGADLLSLSWEKCGLDKRLAMRALCVIGPRIRQQITVWFLLATVLSTLLPNAVVCAVMIPIAVSMLKFVGEADIPQSRIAAVIMVAIAWGSGIGGLGTPLGGAMNLVAVDYFEQLSGQEYAYASWSFHLLPMLVIVCLLNLALLFSIKTDKQALPGSKGFFLAEYAKLPAMNRDEKIGLFIFCLATVLAFLRPLYAAWLPGLKPAYVFLALGMLVIITPSCRAERPTLLSWQEAEQAVLWGLLFIFAGGTALGAIITDTGAAAAIAGIVSHLNLTGGFITVLVFTAFTVMLAETASNTAAAAIALPIVISVTQAAGLDPIPYIYITAAAFNAAYMLPTSIRAIPIGYGLSPGFLFRHGLKQTVATIILIAAVGWLFMRSWPYFSQV